MSLFGVGAMEAGLVLVIALVLVGPQRFPEIAREGGKWYRIARRFTAEVTKDLRVAVDEIESEIKAEAEELQSVRELGNLGEDLKAASSDVQSATEGIAEAAEAAEEPSTPAPTTTAPAPAATETEPTGATGPEANDAPSEPDPQTTDPFKALEARQAAERSRGSGRNGNSGTSS